MAERHHLVLTTVQKVVTTIIVAAVMASFALAGRELSLMRDALPMAKENAEELDRRGEWMKSMEANDRRLAEIDRALTHNQTIIRCELRKLKGEDCDIDYYEPMER
ncbi:MAG: hypothetical protein AAF317_20510 [Pseudomonadota bacterium]